MPTDKPTELSRIKLKTWTRQPVTLISKHSAHSTSLPVGFRTWLWRYTCLLLLISRLWHRQAIFESKGDTLSSSAGCRIRTQGLRHLFASKLNARWQTDWAIEDQAKKLELYSPSLWSASIQPTRPHCQLALHTYVRTYIHTNIHTYINTYIHSCIHACMHACMHARTHTHIHSYIHTCLLLLISMLWHRQAMFEWKGDKLSSSAEGRIRTHQGLRHLFASRLNAHWQTDWAIEDQAKKLELDSPSLWSASIQPTRPHSHFGIRKNHIEGSDLVHTYIVSVWIPTDFRHGWIIFGPLADKNTWKGGVSRASCQRKVFWTFLCMFWDISLRLGI